MSVKAQALVWDLECPKQYGDLMFKPSHKYVLIAYADHADHQGKNIWPAVPTIAKKTGLDDRSVQRLTRDLETIGMLIEDGQGPRGTNKWKLPYDEKGDKLSPVTKCQGDNNDDSLGDIPSGDIPSGDKLTPEVKEPEPSLMNKEGNEDPLKAIWERVLDAMPKDARSSNFVKRVEAAQPSRYDGNTLFVVAPDQDACEWLEDRATRTIEQALLGILAKDIRVSFLVAEEMPA
jgi:hypothetical protein